ncbi:MAG: N-acetylmuramoyl-L-alanine amidase [Bacteroidales bacterium]|nr:N-acetylmuramoyl-L-alanine amidase [Bacteroidales bacterium]
MKKYNPNFLFFTLICFILATSVVDAQDNLRIVRGKIDTLKAMPGAIHYITGVVPIGTTVYVNGTPVKVFKTGSFGAEMRLNEGENPVEIKAERDGSSTIEKFSVYLVKPMPTDVLPTVSDYPGVVVSTKERAYLNYGAGEDRLGGAKINFLSSGIKMELIDSLRALYKVRLSDGRYAFIPKSLVQREPAGTRPAYSLTSSWSVTKSNNMDVVRVALGERLPYIIYQEMEPRRVVVEIHGAANNSNWITQYLDLEAIDYVDFNQVSHDIFRVYIYLKDKYSWGYKAEYAGNSLVISIKHTPQPAYKGSLAGLKIGLDAGHGGRASGAVSTSGIKEKDLNLAMVYMLKRELEKRGASVVLSRSDDSDLTMYERVDIFDAAGVDMMVSVHCNAGGNPLRPGGTSTYYKHIEYRELAKSVLESLLELEVKNFGLVGNFNFSLNAPTFYPNLLVETLFMSSLEDEELLADPMFQSMMMKRVVTGLEDYMKKVKSSLKKR